MTTLTGRSPGNTYKDLLQVSNSNAGVDATLRSVSDGEGTASALQVSTTEAKVNGDLTVTGSVSLSTGVPVSSGGTGSTTEAAARSALGLAIGTDVQAYDADLGALAGLSSAGMVARTGAGTAAARTIAGTAAEITVTNGDGVSGAPTISIPSAVTLTGKTMTGGTFAGAALNGTLGATTPAAVVATTLTATDASVISVSSSSDALRITQTGAGNALLVEDSTNPDSSPFVVNASGNVGIGTSSPTNKLDVSGTARATQGMPIITEAGTAKTLALTDNGGYVRTTSGSAVTITVPLNSSVAFPTGAEIVVFQDGAGLVTFAATGGVTIKSKDSNLSLGGQYSAATLKKVATDTWDLIGDLA